MPTLREQQITVSKETINAPHHCLRCRRPVRWMITYEGGRPRSFDSEPLPSRYDTDHTGWAPGSFLIGARMRYCMAPVTAFTAERQAGIACVLTVHKCQTRTEKEPQLP